MPKCDPLQKYFRRSLHTLQIATAWTEKKKRGQMPAIEGTTKHREPQASTHANARVYSQYRFGSENFGRFSIKQYA